MYHNYDIKERSDIVPKKPKKPWQAKSKCQMEIMGITTADLAERIGESYFNVNQVMCKDNMPNVRRKICEYLGVPEDE